MPVDTKWPGQSSGASYDTTPAPSSAAEAQKVAAKAYTDWASGQLSDVEYDLVRLRAQQACCEDMD